MSQMHLAKKYNFRPVKRLGQNFLEDKNVLERMLQEFDPKPGEVILEIGPGLGVMTRGLLERKAKVIAVEKDPKLCAILNEELSEYQNEFVLVKEDVLTYDFNKIFKDKKIRVIGNLPYYLTSPLIFRLIEERKNIQSAMLMIQKEVAERMLALPGNKDYGRLTVAISFFCLVRKNLNVSRKSFYPSPKVDSTVVTLEFRSESEIRKSGVDPEAFLSVDKKAFSQRRKNILNCFRHGIDPYVGKDELFEIFRQSNIDPNKRAEQLFLKDFLSLCRKLQGRFRFS